MSNDFRKFYRSSHPFGMTAFDDFTKKMGNSLPQGFMSPYVLEERQLNVTQMDVFSRLMMNRIIFFGSEVNSDTSNIAIAQLVYLDSVSDETINLYINSPGGSVYDGLGVVSTMNFIKSPVSTTCVALAASMGSILLASGEAGMRYALPYARVLIHQPMGGCAPHTQATDMQIAVNEINELKKDLYTILSERCNQPYEKIEKDADRDFWMTAKAALDYGIIDKIIEHKP